LWNVRYQRGNQKRKLEKERHHNGSRKKDNQRRRDITINKGKRKIRGETSKWIGEKVQSEKERHHNG
jgi:hypothetical protein